MFEFSGVKSNGSISQVINNINAFYNKGIEVLVVVPSNKEIYRPNSQLKGPFFNHWKLSDIDLGKFDAFMDEFVSEIAKKTPKNAVVALELFNEINWCGYNGDIPSKASIPPSETGIIFDLDTSLDNPYMLEILTGISNL